MKIKLFLIASISFFLYTQGAWAQSVLRSNLGMAGSTVEVNSENQAYFISQSIGQASITGTISKNNYTIRQGYQQPLYSVSAGLNNELKLNAQIYPNPASQWVEIVFNDQIMTEPIQMAIYDNSGRVVSDQRFEPLEKIRVELSGMANGIYILKIFSGKKSLTSSLIIQSYE